MMSLCHCVARILTQTTYRNFKRRISYPVIWIFSYRAHVFRAVIFRRIVDMTRRLSLTKTLLSYRMKMHHFCRIMLRLVCWNQTIVAQITQCIKNPGEIFFILKHFHSYHPCSPYTELIVIKVFWFSTNNVLARILFIVTSITFNNISRKFRSFTKHDMSWCRYILLTQWGRDKMVQIMAWRRTGDRPLSEPMTTQFNDAFMRHSASMR